MQGTGNDFILINQLQNKNITNYKKAAITLCENHFGIGADGLIILLSPENKENDYKMRIFNADGSEAEMCGNGIRCFAHYIYSKNFSGKKTLNIETGAGIIKPEIIHNNKHTGKIKVNMGSPEFRADKIPVLINHNTDSGIQVKSDSSTELKSKADTIINDYPIKVGDKKFEINCVSMGNPHTIIFVNNLEAIELKKWGKIIENMNIFPEKTNVEFVKIIDQNKIKMKVWERGSGITLACGTGACASVVAGIKKELLNNKVEVQLPGGKLWIEWSGQKNDPVKMIGPAVTVFEGEIRGDINGNC